jgi:hypothetical protein
MRDLNHLWMKMVLPDIGNSNLSFACNTTSILPVKISSGLYPPEIIKKIREAQHFQLSDLMANLQRGKTLRRTKFCFSEVQMLKFHHF